MVAPFKCDEKVTIERLTGETDPVYGTRIDAWVVVVSNYWANFQDALAGRGESTTNGRSQNVRGGRLKMRRNSGATAVMRVILHSRGDRIMEIISGPALLDDRVHEEFMLEDYPNG